MEMIDYLALTESFDHRFGSLRFFDNKRLTYRLDLEKYSCTETNVEGFEWKDSN